jgi:tetratricopeptide (TPR) repeat protein
LDSPKFSDEQQQRNNAEALKDQGNGKFKLGHYRDAIKLYSRAISMAPKVSIYYSNRAVAHFKLREFKDCSNDCKKAVGLDVLNHKAHVRLLQAFCELGEFSAAEDHLSIALSEINETYGALWGTSDKEGGISEVSGVTDVSSVEPTRGATYYVHADGQKERVHVRKEHSETEGGGYTVFIPSVGKERQTVADRLDFAGASGMDSDGSSGGPADAATADAAAQAELAARAIAAQEVAGVLREEQLRMQAIVRQLKQGKEALEQEQYSVAKRLYGEVLKLSSAPVVQLGAARAELGLGITARAMRMTLQLLRTDSANAEAYAVHGKALYLNADFPQAEKYLHQALRLNPDLSNEGKVLKQVRKVQRMVAEAKQKAQKRNFDGAILQYTAALELAKAPAPSALAASLHSARATALLREKRYDESMRDCAVAIYAHDDHKESWLTKCSCLMALER